MSVSENPKPRGLSRGKLIGVIALVVGLAVGCILYFGFKDDRVLPHIRGKSAMGV